MVSFGGFLGVIRVAAGDVTGDGIDDLVTGAVSALPVVSVFDGVTNGLLDTLFACPPGLGSGVNVAVANVPGAGAQVVATLASAPVPVVALFELSGTIAAGRCESPASGRIDGGKRGEGRSSCLLSRTVPLELRVRDEPARPRCHCARVLV